MFFFNWDFMQGQGVTQPFLEDDVLKELEKTLAGHDLANVQNVFQSRGSHGVLKAPW